MADNLFHDLEEILVFPYGYFLDLGDGFPIKSYPFSQTRFCEVKVATRLSKKVTTFLYLVIIRTAHERRHLLFVRESEDFIGFLCNSCFSLIQIIIFTFGRIKRIQ